MRKLAIIVLASLLVVPAAALAERVAAGDGSLVVSAANARLIISGHGLIYGHMDRGSITVVGDYKPDDNSSLSSVSGAKQRVTGNSVVYTGSNVRFFFPGGQYSLIVDGTGIDLSAVGKGKITATGYGTVDDGDFTVDGTKTQQIVDTVSASFGANGKSAAFSNGRAGANNR
jgi:hypothetical protein